MLVGPMLNLPGLIVEGMKESADDYIITVAVKEDPPDFDCCLLQKLVLNGRKEALFTDTPMTESFNALARKMNRAGNGYSFEALKKRLVMAHGLWFREDPKIAFNFPYPPGPPQDIGAVVRRLYPVRERPVIGYRLSTLARLAGKLPLN